MSATYERDKLACSIYIIKIYNSGAEKGNVKMQSKSSGNIKGIDVSHHQGNIDWSKVAANGVMFAFIKATEGTTYTDRMLTTNINAAQKAGIKIGFYHYAHPEKGNSAEDEATYFVKKTMDYTCDLAYVLDVEGEASSIGKEKLTTWSIAFLNKVKSLTDKPVMIYTGGSFAKSYLSSSLSSYPLWIAHYGVETPMSNTIWNKWSIFQYTSTGALKGISGNVDLNVMEADYYNELTGITAPIVTEADNVKVIINDILVGYGRNIEGHVYLPLRKLGEAIGQSISWDNNENIPYVGGKVIKMFRLIDSTTYVGVRAVSELFGAEVLWNEKLKKVFIYIK